MLQLALDFHHGLLSELCGSWILPGPTKTFALEAHKNERPAFNRRAVGSIPIGRTRSSCEDVGKR